MIVRADNGLARAMAVIAAVLMTLLVVQTPIAAVDQLLHEAGHSHAANAFAGPLVTTDDHGRDHDSAGADHHPNGDGVDGDQGDGDEDRATTESPPPGAHHHHHHDNTSIQSLALTARAPSPWVSPAPRFAPRDNLRRGIGAPPHDRPPKSILTYVA